MYKSSKVTTRVIIVIHRGDTIGFASRGARPEEIPKLETGVRPAILRFVETTGWGQACDFAILDNVNTCKLA